MRRVVIIAGPNGAGNTTFAREFLPQEAELPVFVNADLIATGLAPFQRTAVVDRGTETMNDDLPDTLRSNNPDPDMQGAPRALLRAAKRAREIAYRTNTPLVIRRNGVLVHHWVTEADLED